MVLQVLLGLGIVGFVILHDWANALLTAAVVILTLVPRLLRHRCRLDVPPEFQLVAALFVFLAFFSGTALGQALAVRELRDLVRHRAKLVQCRTRLRCQLYAVLSGQGVAVPGSDSLWR